MIDLVPIGKNIAREISKNSPAILTGLGVTGVVTTTILGIRATPKALEKIEEAREKKYDDGVDPIDLSKKEIFLATWKIYIPTAAMGLITIGCIIGAHEVHLRRNAAIASLYSLTESAFKEYQAKVVETIGKNKELKVRDDVAGDVITRNPVGNAEVIFTGKGETLCYDSTSGRYFKTDIEKVRRAREYINRQLRDERFVSLNEFYDSLGLSHIKIGYDLGWDINKGYLEIVYTSKLTEDEDMPCLVLNYDIVPRFDHMR